MSTREAKGEPLERRVAELEAEVGELRAALTALLGRSEGSSHRAEDVIARLVGHPVDEAEIARIAASVESSKPLEPNRSYKPREFAGALKAHLERAGE